jgi:hypothetical protein
MHILDSRNAGASSHVNQPPAATDDFEHSHNIPTHHEPTTHENFDDDIPF